MNWDDHITSGKVFFFNPTEIYGRLIFLFLLTFTLAGISSIVVLVLMGKELDYYLLGATIILIILLFLCVRFLIRFTIDLNQGCIRESFIFMYGGKACSCYEFTSKEYKLSIFDSILLDKYYEPYGYERVLYVRLRMHASSGSLVLTIFPETSASIVELKETGKRLSAFTGIKYVDIRGRGVQPLRSPRPCPREASPS